VRALIHCSYHKCLTVYYGKVAAALFNKFSVSGIKYKHFNSRIDEFLAEYSNYKLTSVNNRSLDLSRFGPDLRVTRFIRDPRDLVVSGYFYHKRGAERWCHLPNPSAQDWYVINGSAPACLGEGETFTSYLNRLDEEDGLIAEIDFRSAHFDSMRNWGRAPDSRIKLFKYEEIMGNEPDVFSEMTAFYGLSYPQVLLSKFLASRYSAGRIKNPTHIRNVSPHQWKRHFTKKVGDYFEARHGDILELYGYQ
jgi:hypothetical protein